VRRLVEEFTYNGLGSQRTVSDSMHIISTGAAGGSSTTFRTRNYDYYSTPANKSRLRQLVSSDMVTLYEYDLGGNQTFVAGARRQRSLSIRPERSWRT